MDINVILNGIIPVVFGLVGIALVVLVLELVKILKVTRATLEDMQPKLDATMANVQQMTTDIVPTVAKIEPMVDSLQLTVDTINLEMMRVDQILEDITDITDAASSATAAVDNITNAPLNAVNNVASRVRSAFGGKSASQESAQLAEQRKAVAQALEEYKAAEKKEADKATDGDAAANAGAERPAVKPLTPDEQPNPDVPDSYVRKFEEGSEPVIDPKIIAESAFFEEGSDAE